MDYAIFLRELKLTPRDWFLNETGQIRYPADQDTGPIPLGSFPACPLNRLRGLHSFAIQNYPAIMVAADHPPARLDTHLLDIRRDLIAACGLTE